MYKKRYSCPVLTVHGSVEKLTQVLGTITSDLINGVDDGDTGTIDLVCVDVNDPTTCTPAPGEP